MIVRNKIPKDPTHYKCGYKGMLELMLGNHTIYGITNGTRPSDEYLYHQY